MFSSLSNSTLIYCGKADPGHFLRSFSLNRTTIRLKRAPNLPQNDLPLATIGQARQAASSLRWRRALALLVLLVGGAAQAAVDPTRPPAVPAGVAAGASVAPATAALRLEAIRTLGGQRTAVINGQRVGPGDRIGSARVSRIDAGSVTLTRDGKPERLQLGSGLTKQWIKQD